MGTFQRYTFNSSQRNRSR